MNMYYMYDRELLDIPVNRNLMYKNGYDFVKALPILTLTEITQFTSTYHIHVQYNSVSGMKWVACIITYQSVHRHFVTYICGWSAKSENMNNQAELE